MQSYKKICIFAKNVVPLRNKMQLFMKKVSFLSLLLVVLLGFTSCNQQEQQPCKFHKQTIDLVVAQQDWQFDSQTQQFFCHFDIDELTADMYNYSEVSVSHEYNSGTKNAYQVALPETSYMVEQDGTNTFYYQQHIDYIYGIGYIEIFYTVSDFFYADGWKPDGMLFRMQLTY